MAVNFLVQALIQVGKAAVGGAVRKSATKLLSRSLLKRSAKRAVLRKAEGQMQVFRATKAATSQAKVATKVAQNTKLSIPRPHMPTTPPPLALRRFPPSLPQVPSPARPMPGTPFPEAPSPTYEPGHHIIPEPSGNSHPGNAVDLSDRGNVDPKSFPDMKDIAASNYFPAQGNFLDRTMYHMQSVEQANAAAGRFFPKIGWVSSVVCQGFKTTPSRTVVHFALALAFGMIKQSRLGDVYLQCNLDHVTNTASITFASNTNPLCEILTMAMRIWTGQGLDGLGKDVGMAVNGIVDQTSIRDLLAAGISGPSGIIELGVKNAGNVALSLIPLVIKSYQNMSRKFGPQAVYDMGEESLFGGYPSALLDYGTIVKNQKNVPQPFASFLGQELVTRRNAPNPQIPGPPEFPDVSMGYSTDLRSLVAQVLSDPGIRPPYPDSNVSLQPSLEG